MASIEREERAQDAVLVEAGDGVEVGSQLVGQVQAHQRRLALAARVEAQLEEADQLARDRRMGRPASLSM